MLDELISHLSFSSIRLVEYSTSYYRLVLSFACALAQNFWEVTVAMSSRQSMNHILQSSGWKYTLL